nr:potassium/sodium hyperpolarization-activated cyclic nucleotide-gated channel 1-like [Leptinotarsa decemlineata]
MTLIDHHDCKLQREAEESIIKQIIDTGIFINTRRKICGMSVINKAHPKTQLYYKSSAACRKEELRQVVSYPMMSHPFCIWCLYWEFFIFFVFLLMYICNTVGSFFVFHDDMIFRIDLVKFVGDSILLLDIIHIFFKGYYDTEKSRTIMKQSQVAKKYLMTNFFIDVTASVPSYIFFVLLFTNVQISNGVMMCIRFIGLLRILRIGRWLDTMELFRQYMNYSSYLFKGIRAVSMYMIMMASLIATMITVLNAIHIFKFEITAVTNKTKMMFSVILTLLVVSHGNTLPDNTEVVTVITLFLCIGYIMQLFLYAQILQVFNKFARARDTNENLLRQFKEYMKYKGLPSNLRERIFTYFQFKFQNEFFSEPQINSMISELLRQEILEHVTKKHINKSKLFSSLPEQVLLQIVSHLKSVIYLPDDVIVTAGKRSQTMFFINYGTVAVFTAMGQEMYHLEDGDSFGEMALVFNESATVTIVAVTPCELFRLKRSDFYSVLDLHEDLKAEIISRSRSRLLKYRSEFS